MTQRSSQRRRAKLKYRAIFNLIAGVLFTMGDDGWDWLLKYPQEEESILRDAITSFLRYRQGGYRGGRLVDDALACCREISTAKFNDNARLYRHGARVVGERRRIVAISVTAEIVDHYADVGVDIKTMKPLGRIVDLRTMEAYLSMIDQVEQAKHCFEEEWGNVVTPDPLFFYRHGFQFSLNSAYSSVRYKNMYTRYRRDMEKKLDFLENKSNPSELTTLYFPDVNCEYVFRRANISRTFLFTLPLVDFFTEKCVNENYEVTFEGSNMRFFYGGACVLVIKQHDYLWFIAHNEHSCIVHRGFAVVSRGIGTISRDDAYVILYDENRSVPILATDFCHIKLRAIECNCEQSQVLRAVSDRCPAVIPDIAMLAVKAISVHVMSDLLNTIVYDEAESSWWYSFLVPLVLAGKMLNLLPSLFVSLTRRFLRWALPQPSVGVTASIPDTAYGKGGFWVFTSGLITGYRQLTGDARELVDRIQKANGYSDMLDQAVMNFIPMSDESPDIEPALISNGGAFLAAAVTSTDAAHVLLSPDWQEYIINTTPDVIPIPEAMRLKTHFADGQMYKMRLIHLPTVFVREMPRQSDVNSIFRAVNTRNFGVAHIDSRIDATRFFYDHLPNHAEAIWVDDWQERLDAFGKNPIFFDTATTEAYVRRMPPDKLNAYLNVPELKPMELSAFDELEAILKREVKPQLVHGKIGEPQTVVFLSKTDASAAQVVMAEANRRYQSLKRSNVISVDGFSERDLESFYNVLSYPQEQTLRSVQRDLSQYDKSLGHTPHVIMKEMNRLMGVPAVFLDAYYDKNQEVSVRFVGTYLRATIAEQQRSGLPTTLSDNTVVNEFTESYLAGYKRHQIVSWVSQGDDIEVVVTGDYNVPSDTAARASHLFNLIEKRYVHGMNARYNCSRLILFIRGKWRVIYDPWKFIAKFNRGLTTYDYGKLQERYVAYRSLMTNYGDVEVREKTALACYHMYGFQATDTFNTFNACQALMLNYETFRSSWQSKPVKR